MDQDPFLIWPNPRLVTSGAPIARIDDGVRADLDRIEAAMVQGGYDGLAGGQIGVMRRLAVIGGPGPVLRAINPKIIWRAKDDVMRLVRVPELPGLEAELPVPAVLTLRWHDEAGFEQEKVLTGARALGAFIAVEQVEGRPLFEKLDKAGQRAALVALTRARKGLPPEDGTVTIARDAEAEPFSAAEMPFEGPPSMRLIFMGTPEFSVAALDALVEEGHEICAVYTQPPRPAGRGKKLRPSPVQIRAEELGLEVRSPKSLRGADEQAALRDLGADLAVVVAYGLILPQGALDAPLQGCLNIHASLLPRWRGAAPIQRAIMAGDTRTGVCIMRMEAGLDTGPVLMRRPVPIGPRDTAASLHDRLAEAGAEMITQSVAALGMGPMGDEPQPDEGVTYAAKIEKAEAEIDWTRPAAELDCHIRGLSPFPGAWFAHEGDRIKVLMCEPAEGEGTPGETLDDALTVACGSGALKLTRIQRAGKGAMDTAEALRGLPIAKGAQLG